MRISKKTREEAILICAVAASTPGASYLALADWLGVSYRARNLAYNAHSFAYQRVTDATIQLGDAEGEALLQTGWCP